MSDPNIEILKYETYLKAIENSVGSRIFNSLIVKFRDSDQTSDILGDGEFSCAFFVSSILAMFGVLDKPRATVISLKDIISKDEKWSTVSETEAQPGDVVFYEAVEHESGNVHEHVAFVTGSGQAVSTDYKQKQVVQHDLKYRQINSIYRYQ